MTAPDTGMNSAGTTTEQILAEAIAWVERADRENWSADDETALEEWLARSNANTVAFLRARDGWRRADRLVALRGTLEPQRPNISVQSWSWRIRTGIGAAAIALSLMSLLVLQGHSQRPDAYSTDVGGHKLLTLADGSRVELNTDTFIRTHLGDHQRTVWIERGEAYFQIAHSTTKPFVVLANGHRITDLGTKFVVRKEADEVQVTLLEGRAALDAPDKDGSRRTILAPGDIAVATVNAVSVLKRSKRAMDDDLSWRRGVLVFDRTSLADAAAELNRYNTRKVVIADAEAAQERIEGTFPANNVELFGRVAKSVLGLQVQKQGTDIVISR